MFCFEVDKNAQAKSHENPNDEGSLITRDIHCVFRRDEEKNHSHQDEKFTENDGKPEACFAKRDWLRPLFIWIKLSQFDQRREHKQIGDEEYDRREGKDCPEDLLDVLPADGIPDDQAGFRNHAVGSISPG